MNEDRFILIIVSIYGDNAVGLVCFCFVRYRDLFLILKKSST